MEPRTVTEGTADRPPVKASISACTFLRNGMQLGFPFVESIRSILPIVDEFVVAVGKGGDDTLERVRAIGDPRIRVIETEWNERMRDRGFVYAQQKMIAQYSCTGDWVFYLEGDEVVHERDLARIVDAADRHLDDARVEALLFDYLHFYGSPDWIACSPMWYRRECRIVRNTIRSYAPDGQYWLITDRHRRPRMPRAAPSGARIYHYGHVRKQPYMQEKLNQVGRYWNAPPVAVDYRQIDPRALRRFQGEHPAIIGPWLERHAERSFEPDPAHVLTPRERKHRVSMFVERLFGVDLSRKHYRLVRR